MCTCLHTSTHRQHSNAPELPVEADRNRESSRCVCWLSFHSLVGQGTRRRGSPSYRHRNNESSSVSDITLLSLEGPKALPVCPSMKKILTAEESTQRESSHAYLSTTDPTCCGSGSNPGHRCEKLTTERPRHEAHVNPFPTSQ
jgi:hypothetical protein